MTSPRKKTQVSTSGIPQGNSLARSPWVPTINKPIHTLRVWSVFRMCCLLAPQYKDHQTKASVYINDKSLNETGGKIVRESGLYTEMKTSKKLSLNSSDTRESWMNNIHEEQDTIFLLKGGKGTKKLSTKELTLLNCVVGEDSWESLGLQGDPTSPF